MRKSGLIERYTVVMNRKKLGRALSAYVLVTINYNTMDGSSVKQEDVAHDIFALHDVEECAIITGGADIMVRVSVSDIEHLNNFVVSKLRNIKNVEKTQTCIILNDIGSSVRKCMLPVEGL